MLRFINLSVERFYKPWLHNDFLYSLTKDGKEAEKCVKILHDFSSKVIKQKKLIRSQSKKDHTADDEYGNELAIVNAFKFFFKFIKL